MDTFGFDCVCLIKGVLWGWNGDKKATYGGAKYNTNNVPDINADQMIGVCKNVSTDFSKIEVGEALWSSGHIGVYIGDGLAVECTPRWENKVQITACNRNVAGYNRRDWVKHGKLPYITYESSVQKPAPVSTPQFKKGDLVKVTGSKYYNGKSIPLWVRLKKWYVAEVSSKFVIIDKSEDGKNSIYSAVNASSLQLIKSSSTKSTDEIAREVISGKWGTGSDRKSRLTAAGYDYATVQKRVNELLK